jgi:hypothetical protein
VRAHRALAAALGARVGRADAQLGEPGDDPVVTRGDDGRPVVDLLDPGAAQQVGPRHDEWPGPDPVGEPDDRGPHRPVVEWAGRRGGRTERDLADLGPPVGVARDEVHPAADPGVDPGDLARALEAVVVERHRPVAEQRSVPVPGLLHDPGLLGAQVGGRGRPGGVADAGCLRVGGAGGGEEGVADAGARHGVGLAGLGPQRSVEAAGAALGRDPQEVRSDPGGWRVVPGSRRRW